ncbi:MAG: DUF3089 domain-containing protein [Bacteroidales bacterium]|nr:DUF3089 domain-containing protein [Bacteroidales bacterium]MBR5028982.1 DUF3089 domain-containing protein [Bacteroidales bacterium]
MKRFSISSLTAICVVLLVGCCRKAVPQDEVMPPVPDYADSSQWHIAFRNAPVDVFYIISTETGDYATADGQICHYADTYVDSLRQPMLSEMTGVDELLCGNLNYFSPYYRQCTLESFTSDSLAQARFALSMKDVGNAFDYYIKNKNNGRPFILMGFSQGAMAVIELLKQMSDEVYSRMVAAYVFGWRITDNDLAQTSHIRPALDSADLGVTICYNSVRDNSCAIPLISDGNSIAINPVNWRTDATPATLVSPISPDTITATLDTISKLLVVDGYSREDYILPLIGREGNYHCLEISLYQSFLKRNIALRAERYVTSAQKTTTTH